jgi:hypothetical protein
VRCLLSPGPRFTGAIREHSKTPASCLQSRPTSFFSVYPLSAFHPPPSKSKRISRYLSPAHCDRQTGLGDSSLIFANHVLEQQIAGGHEQHVESGEYPEPLRERGKWSPGQRRRTRLYARDQSRHEHRNHQ